MADLAKAYVQIIPSAQGIEGQLENLMGGEAEAAGTKAGGLFAGKFGTALKIGGLAAAAGIFAVGKEAVSAYADYEQLVGGVETLFSSLDGTVSAAPQVLAAAENAYKTAGLSANQYMETVTSFSAALVSSLDGDYAKAAEVSDMAITDMADNANKMGSSMQSIQDAYQGFAKQNYTMLDNLKLGYGGTKTEMERLLADASALSGVDYSIDNLNDVYEAIHVIQGEMGITGTTAAEAASTISGSFAMTKAALDNLLTGLADPNADLEQLMGNLVDSAGTFLQNIVPAIGQALQGIGQAAPQLVESLVSGLTSNLPAIVEGGVQLLAGLVTGLIQALPQLISYAPQIISTLLNGILSGLDQILGAGEQLLEAACNGIGNAIGAIFTKGAEMAQNAWNGITSWFGQIFQAGAELVAQAGNGIAGAASSLYSKGTELVQKVKDGFMAMVRGAVSWGSDLVKNIASGIMSAISWVSNAASSIANAIARPLKHSVPTEGPLADDDKWGGHLVQNLIGGMQREEGNLRRQAEGVAGIVRDSMRFDTSFRLQTQAMPAAAFAGGGYDSSDVVAELRATRRALMNMGFYADGKRIGDMVDHDLGRRRAGKERRTV